MTAAHRIGELLFDLAFESPAMRGARSEELRSLVVDTLLPLMETVFDEFGGGDAVRRIDTLDLHVGDVTEADLPAALVAGLRTALERALHDEEKGDATAPSQETAGTGAPGRAKRHRGDIDVLLAFLGDGVMPWHIDAAEPASHEILLSRVLASDADEFLRSLAASPHRAVMLTRLARQFAPAQLAQLLRKMAPGHADAMLSRLTVLQELLQDTALTRTVRGAALQAAWEAAFAAALNSADGTSQSVARTMTERALHRLAEQLHEDLAAVAEKFLSARAGRRAGDAAGDTSNHTNKHSNKHTGKNAGDDEIIRVLRELSGTVFPADAGLGAFPTEEAAAGDIQGQASGQSAGHARPPQTLHEPPSAMVPIRNRMTSALMGGNAGDIYDDWVALQDNRPDLLRSAILHYAGYGEIREKMASAFPLSMLLDMEALLSPEAAALTALVWNDERLQDRLGADAAAQWSHWRRGWWRGAVAYLLPLARSRDDMAGSAAAASFNIPDYVAAALEGAGAAAAAAGEDVSDYVEALARGSDPQSRHAPAQRSAAQAGDEQQREIPPALSQAPAPAPSLASLFDAIRSGADPLRASAFDPDQLEQWVREAVQEPSFFQAIADHAAAARDRRAYFTQVLQALARNRIVDLEEFAAAEDTASAPATQQQAMPDAQPAAEGAGAGAAEERDKAQLVGRLAKALMKGDPAPLYGDWDILLHKHAPLLAEALRHYGIRDDILQRIALSFPESMLYDMAVLLAPGAVAAWRTLRDQAAWAALSEAAAVSSPDPTAPSLDQNKPLAPQGDHISPASETQAAWKRQLWKAVLRQLLRSGQGDFGAIHALTSSLAEDAELVRAPWQRRVLMRWADLSAQSSIGTSIDTSINASIGALLTAADIERRIEAHILAQEADDAGRQQRRLFLQAIRTQAPTAPEPDRVRYFDAVLQALLQDETLDLEDIAEASKSGGEHIAADGAGDDGVGGRDASGAPAMQMPATDAFDRPDPENAAHADFLLSPDFRTGVALPPGLVEWLNRAIDAAAPALTAMLAELPRHPEALARLLEIVPASSRQKLAALAPYSPLQVQRMRRYAGDVTDMFAEQHRQLSSVELARLEWRFLLPYLFAPDRIFEPARFSGELVGFLARESGLPVSAALASRLRSQMGVAAALPRAVSHLPSNAASRAAASADMGAQAQENTGAGKSDGRPAQIARTHDDASPQASSGIHVANAGMVLAWPFLSRAWEVLELTREGKFVDDAAAQRAAWLLEFAVNEQTAVPEYQLTLNKLLCGIPLQAPIVPEIEVTEQERELIEQLLTVMISHWSAIGNTSIQGLRETFLQREGYLSRKEDAWRLEVPKRTFDMLLDKLPWSISTIRLPWMETILWVEWT